MIYQSYDVIIIGGGVLGCALARSLALQRRTVLVLEKEPDVGLHTSGRNSGIVHAGFEASPGSLTARLCVEGNHALRKYATSRHIPFDEVGAYVVAKDEQEVSTLEDLKGRGDRNGVPNLQILPISKVQDQEPNIHGHAALYAPTASIIDARLLTKTLAQDAIKLGAQFMYWQEVVDVQERADAVCVSTHENKYVSEMLINCAGLHADRLAHSMGVGGGYLMVPFRGVYATVDQSMTPLVRSIISPAPTHSSAFLSVHITKTPQGSVLVGPNAVPIVEREGYGTPGRQFSARAKLARHRMVWKAAFRNRRFRDLVQKTCDDQMAQQYLWREASKVIQGLDATHLSIGNRVGIRPQLISPDGEIIDDLIVESTERSVHVLNMVVPGLTCSLAFAKWLTDRMQGAGQGAKFKTPFLASVS